MSDQQHMDDFFKQGLEDYEPPVPDGAWERIVEERKKRRAAIVWWRRWRTIKLMIFFIAAGLVAVGSFLMLNDNKSVVAGSSNTSIDTASHRQITTVETIKANAALVQSTDSLGKAAVAGNGIQTIAPSTLTIAAGVAREEKEADNKNLFTNDNNNFSSATFKTQHKILKARYKKSGGRTTMQASGVNIGTAEVDEFSDESNPPATGKGDQDGNEISLQKIPFNLFLITAASLVDINKASVSDGIKYGPDCPEAEKNAAGNKTYWEAYTSVDYATKKYTDTANSLYAAKRKETTSFYSAYSAGIRVTKVFSNGVSVRAGLNFSQINEKFSFVQSNTVQTTYIIDALTGDTTGSYIVRGTKYKTSFNRYRTLDIPLVIGYEIGNGRLHANFNAGAMVNVYSWQKGELLDTAFQPVSITTGKGLPAFQYKTNIGVGFTAAVSVYYKLNNRLHLMAEPYLRYNFSPMNRDALSLQERFTTLGVRLGLRIDF